VVVLCAVLVPAIAVVVSARQQKLYGSSAEVLIKRQNLAATLTGAGDTSAYQTDDRIVQTQADLAHSPAVADGALKALRLHDRSPEALAAQTTVTPKPNSDFLIFTVIEANPNLSAPLATAFASSYTRFRRDLDTKATRQALAEVQARLRTLKRSPANAGLLNLLIGKEQQLQTLDSLQTANAFVTHKADSVAQVQPQPVRNGVLGFLVGLVLGVGFAFLLDVLDTRVRSEEEIGEQLGLPLLGRLPAPPGKLQESYQLVTLAEPSGPRAEAVAMVRVALELANVDREVKVIMTTSAVAREGKSTSVANLAVAFARGGRRVVLVDLDLRRPMLHRFFGLESQPGVTDVLRGAVPLEEALVRLPLDALMEGAPVFDRGQGSLHLLPSGPLPPSPGDFVGTPSLGNILRELADDADIVLVDGPPMLPVSDVISATVNLDALIIVSRVAELRRPQLRELARLIRACPIPVLGHVVTDARIGGGYGYDTYYSNVVNKTEMAGIAGES
jgi:capsular exopolysaccharide synthesis family protein